MAKNIAASVKRRLLNQARETGGDFNQLLERYTRERFLYRLSQSTLADKFILKGASVFQVWLGNPHRTTKDIDLLASGSNNPQDVKSIFTDIAQQNYNDGIEFTEVKSSVLQAGQKYEGVRLDIAGKMESAKLLLQVDVGYGHAVTPKAQVYEIPSLLDLPRPKMLVYPQETVISEKFQAMVERGLGNSRVKDYFDLYYIRENLTLNGEQLRQAIKATFDQRGTLLDFNTDPVGLTAQYTESNPSREKQWQKMVKQSGTNYPLPLEKVVPKIAEFVMPVAKAAATDTEFKLTWSPQIGWASTQKIELVRSIDIVSAYSNYSQNISQKGLLGAKEIARKALSEGVTANSIAEMLIKNNSAYNELVSSSGAQKAQEIVIRKAQIELQRQDQDKPQNLLDNQQSQGKSR